MNWGEICFGEIGGGKKAMDEFSSVFFVVRYCKHNSSNLKFPMSFQKKPIMSTTIRQCHSLREIFYLLLKLNTTNLLVQRNFWVSHQINKLDNVSERPWWYTTLHMIKQSVKRKGAETLPLNFFGFQLNSISWNLLME